MSDILNQVISIAQLIENNDDGDCFNETLVYRPKQCYCDDEIHGITLQFRRLDTLCKSDDDAPSASAGDWVNCECYMQV